MQAQIPSSLCSRRAFLRGASAIATSVLAGPVRAETQASPGAGGQGITAADRERMRALAAWTKSTFDGPNPVPFGAEIVDTKTGERLVRALNVVGPEHDPSAHGEVHAMRLGCAKLKSPSLRGYTLYTTCEPCPMCMACALWAVLDRMVYGATIEDAAKFGPQLKVPAAEIARRGDLHCIVDGPVEREVCLALFTDPRMQKTFEMWRAVAR